MCARVVVDFKFLWFRLNLFSIVNVSIFAAAGGLGQSTWNYVTVGLRLARPFFFIFSEFNWNWIKFPDVCFFFSFLWHVFVRFFLECKQNKTENLKENSNGFLCALPLRLEWASNCKSIDGLSVLILANRVLEFVPLLCFTAGRMSGWCDAINAVRPRRHLFDLAVMNWAIYWFTSK